MLKKKKKEIEGASKFPSFKFILKTKFFHRLQNINSSLIASIYGDKYYMEENRHFSSKGAVDRTILTNHEDNTLAGTIRSILVSRVRDHVT